VTNLTIRTCFYQLPRPMTVFMNRLRGLIGHRAFVQVSDETLAGLASYDRVVIAESARMLFGIYSWEIGGCCLTSRMIQTWMWSRLFHRQSGFTDRPLGSITRQLAATETTELYISTNWVHNNGRRALVDLFKGGQSPFKFTCDCPLGGSEKRFSRR